MTRSTTFKRIITAAVATIALGASIAPTALAVERGEINVNGEPVAFSCTTGPNTFTCKVGKRFIGCALYPEVWRCWVIDCTCAGADPAAEEQLSRAIVEAVELYLARTMPPSVPAV